MPESSPARSAGVLVFIAAALCAAHAFAAGAPNLLVGLALLAALAVALALGGALCGILGWREGPWVDLPHALVLGMVVLGVLLMALALASPLSISGNFLLCALLAGGLVRVQMALRPPALGTEHPFIPRIDNAGLFTVAVALFAATCWSAENLRAIRPLGPDLMEAYPWKDMFVHAKNVSRFMKPSGAAGLGNDQLLGLPLPPYHYASYMVPALAGRISGAHSYPLAASFLPMLGMLWTALAAYVLGKTCKGAWAGAAAALGVLLVPDPSAWGLGNGWTGYFFFQQVGVAGPYAVAALALAASHGLRASQQGDWRLLLSAAVLTGMAAFYKVQIVLVYGMPLAVFVLWRFRAHSRPLAAAGSLAVVGTYVVALSLMGRIPNAPSISFSTEGAWRGMAQAIRSYPQPIADSLAQFFPADGAYLRTLLLGIPLVLAATYGLWLPVLAACARRVRGAGSPMSFVWWLAVVCVAVQLVAAFAVTAHSTGYGDVFEITHKPFVWPYFMVAVAGSILAADWVLPRLRAMPGRRGLLVGATAVALGAGAVAAIGPATQSSLVWSGAFVKTSFPRVYADAAAWLRETTHPDAVVQLSGNDPFLILSALSERNSFVNACAINCGPPKPFVLDRFAQVERLLDQADAASVFSGARALGIDWLVVQGAGRPWQAAPQARPDAAFGELQLYATAPRR